MTPEELHAAVEEQRLRLGLYRWQVAVAVDISQRRLQQLAHGHCGPALRRRVEAWLEIRRHTGLPRKE